VHAGGFLEAAALNGGAWEWLDKMTKIDQHCGLPGTSQPSMGKKRFFPMAENFLADAAR
jgi:hypothetical protein